MVSNDRQPGQLDISVVIPMFNEEGSVTLLHAKLVEIMEKISHEFEIIYVDDGSTDNSVKVISDIVEKDPRVLLIELKTNMGKARALSEGFKAAAGEIIVTMDADLQDDPKEIPNFLKKLDEGYDMVSGWKKKRHDPFEKRWLSKLFNKITSMVTGMELHDFNCGFKAYRREIFSDIRVYGDLHRYLPALAYGQGYTVGEIPVQHHARQFGKSKYGFERYLRGLFDLFTVTLLNRFIRNPMILFGGIGIIFLAIGLIIISFLTVLQAWYGSILGHKPLSFLAVLLILLGGQTFSLGMLAEFLGNISLKKGLRQISIRNRVNFADTEPAPVDLSVIVAVRNASAKLFPFYEACIATLDGMDKSYEILFVDDGSDDDTNEIIRGLCKRDQRVRLIRLRKRFGKASALNAGFRNVRGEILVIMDGDLQDDPADLLIFADHLKSCDMVIGNRMNVPYKRKIVAIIFSRLVYWTSGVKIHDFNCGLKVLRKNVVRDLYLNDGSHRFFPVLVAKNGYKVTQLNVSPKARNRGQSKYNWTRIPKDLFNLLNIILLSEYYRRPLHLFGSIGLIFAFIGFAICGALSLLKFFTGTIQGHNTLLLLGVVNIVFGFQWISCGMLGEIIAGLDEGNEERSIVKRKTQRF
jgi:glycosyltransferase involved in cell wall biosynthesis